VARRKRERVEKIVIVTGTQRPDIDTGALARVLIRLARDWAEQQTATAPDDDTSANAGRDDS
jgi:hypothetical protein